MRQALAKRSVIGLLLAAPLGAEPALAQSFEDRFTPFSRIRCAGASELCAWKRIPDAGGFEGFEARPARPRSLRRSTPPR